MKYFELAVLKSMLIFREWWKIRELFCVQVYYSEEIRHITGTIHFHHLQKVVIYSTNISGKIMCLPFLIPIPISTYLIFHR